MPFPKGPPLWQVGSDTTLGKISSSPPCSATSPETCSALRKKLLGLWHLLSSKAIQRVGDRRKSRKGKGRLESNPVPVSFAAGGRGRGAESGAVSGEGPNPRHGFLNIGFYYCQFRPQNLPNSLLCSLLNSFFFITECILQGFFQGCLWEMNCIRMEPFILHSQVNNNLPV